MSEVNNIFSLPPIVLEKVRLSEILELLRERVNKHYMPSANGSVQFNSKPSYLQNSIPEHPDFPNVHAYEWTGYFCLEKLGSHSRPIYFNLRIEQFQILVNLENEKAIVCLMSEDGSAVGDKFFEWSDDPEQTLPLMRDKLKESIDMYG